MGIHNLGPITAELLAADLSPSTPVALIRWGTYPQQETLIGTLETIVAQVAAAGFDAPAVAVIGQVVGWHEVFKHCRPTGTLWPD
jgi:uroporphyrin-III C-methyltransferase